MGTSPAKALLCFTAGLFAATLVACQPKAPAPVSAAVPLDAAPDDATWIVPDSRGIPRSPADFLGQVVVFYFGYMSCPDACPTALAKMAAVHESLGDSATRLQVVMVTVDPERDTPERLSAYVSWFNSSFMALRPEPGTVDSIARPFRVYYRKVPLGAGYTVDHSLLLYVIDCSGKRRFALPSAQTPAELLKALRPLVSEPGCRRTRNPGTGAAGWT